MAAERIKRDATPLANSELKGKVDVKFFGHAGFKIHFLDAEEVHRNIYIDIFIDGIETSEEDKKNCPNDCDLALVTMGQGDHSTHCPFLAMGGKKEVRTLICNNEVAIYMMKIRKVPAPFIHTMGLGGTRDYGYCKITMVKSDFPSATVTEDRMPMPGGNTCGYIIEIPHHNLTVYHPGDTNLMGDMKLIDELYKPDLIFLPIGNVITMGPREAAYATANFFKSAKYVIPMKFRSCKEFTGTFDQFKKECEKLGVKDKEIMDPKDFKDGAALLKN